MRVRTALALCLLLLTFVMPARAAGRIPAPAEPPGAPLPTVAVYHGPTTSQADVLRRAVLAYRWVQGATAPPEAPKPVPVKRAATGGQRRVVAAPPSSGGGGGDSRFDRLAQCESGGNPQAVSLDGRYRGAFQFSLSTWRSAGMTGDPIDFSYSEQEATAEGWAARSDPFRQWPICWARTL